jgi:hypothetical protein
MSGPIQVIPQGLLGLLQLKATGKNPDDLLAGVQPQVDLFPLWVQRQDVDINLAKTGNSNTGFNVNASGNFGVTGLIVGNTEAWFVTNFTLRCNLLAAETIVMACGFNYPTALSNVYELSGNYADVITARARTATVHAGGFWLGPGAQPIIIVHDQTTAATITVAFGLRGVIVPI